jgi:ectoine hydroxylase-related dioxygenase (phytanoyl-CoA dioxygenase family)
VSRQCLAEIEKVGFCLIPYVLNGNALTTFIDALAEANIDRSSRGAEVYGARNILAVPKIEALAHSPEIVGIVQSLIGPESRPVRGIFFDKTPGANWPVAWHQDLTLAVSRRHEMDGWTNWSVKAGVIHVQPPVEILERMVTLRVQLDDCDADNGPLRVLPGSHRFGRLSADKNRELRSEIAERVCCAPAGSVLAMKPLLLHASSAAKNPKHRRVIHLEFAPEGILPPEIEWPPIAALV